MSELQDFGTIVLIVSAGFAAAVALSRLTERVPVPGPAVFLLVAAIATDVFPGLNVLEIREVERIGVVALVVILFDGGMHVGWRRFRGSALPITLLGTGGTVATAGVMAVLAHALFDFDWTTAWLLGAALAPTDPAVMFSVLGKREITGRTGTILEGESGANDPVGIALMIGILEFATHDDASVWIVVEEFAVEMSVGLAVGVAGAGALLWLLRRFTLPNAALYPLRSLALAGAIYGVAALAHGSGFLAVFVAGILIGDHRAPRKGEIERFHKSLASLAEISVFVALGLTIDITDLGKDGIWLDGLLLALLLAFVVRPLVVGPLLARVRLQRGERIIVIWGGLKGAVPILLGSFALLEGVEGAGRIYSIVFVVVAFSVIVQGTSIPLVAPRLGVRMRVVEPRGRKRLVVGPGSRAAGTRVRDLPLGERMWIDEVVRDGQPFRPRGSFVLQPGDQATAILSDVEDVSAIERLFRGFEPGG